MLAHGALGDGVADDTSKIQNAIDAVSGVGGGVVYFPEGTYKTTSTVTIPANVSLVGTGAGSVIKPHDTTTSGRQFRVQGTNTGSYTLASDVAAGAFAMTLSTGQGANFAAGDYIKINTATPYTQEQIFRVASVSTDTVTVELAIPDAYTAAASSVTKVHPVAGVQVRDLVFDGTNVTGTNSAGGLSFWYGLQPVVQNVTFRNFGANAGPSPNDQIGGVGLEVLWCIEPQVDGVRFDLCGGTGVNAMVVTSTTLGNFGSLVFHHGGFHLGINSVTYSNFHRITSTYAGWQTLGGRSIKCQRTCSFNSFGLIQTHRAHSNGLGFVQGCHHNVVVGLVATGHLNDEGVWFDGEGSTHNQVLGYVGRFNDVFDVGMYSGTDQYNFVGGDFDPSKVSTTGGADSTNKVVSLTDGVTIPVVTAAATITVPFDTDIVQVNGTTTITKVNVTRPGHRITLIFQAALTFTDGSNLKLAGNMTTSADDTITLVCDGTNWLEIARSAN